MPIPNYDDVAGGIPPWMAAAADLPPPPLPPGYAPGGAAPPTSGPDAPPSKAPIPPPPLPGVDTGLGMPDPNAPIAAPPPVAPAAPVPPPPTPGIDLGMGTPAALAAAPPPSIAAPPAPGAPDAISDATAGVTPKVADLVNVHNETRAEQYEGDPWDNPNEAERDAAAAKLALTDPAKFAVYVSHLAERKAQAEAEARAKVEQDNLDRLTLDLEDRKRADAITQAKSDQIIQDATALANKAADPHHWFNSLGVIGKIGAIAQVIIGGAMSQFRGGHNTGQEWVDQQIDRDIKQQTEQIQNQRDVLTLRNNAVAQEFKRTGDLATAQATVRQAAYTAAINKLATQQQDFDPQGTSFARIGGAIQQLAGSQQKALEEHAKEQHAQAMAELKEAREERAQAETARKNRAEEAIAWAKEAREGAKAKADNTLLTPAEIHAQFPDLPASAIPPVPMTRAELGKHVEIYNKTVETGHKQVENATQLAGTQVQGPDGTPLTQDGTPRGKAVVMPTAELADKLNDKIAAAQNLVNALGRARRFIATDPSAVSRQDWAAVTSDLENAKVAYIEQHGAKPSSREMQAVEDLFGKNFDGYVDRVKDKSTALGHIDAIVRDAKQRTATELAHKAKYTGPSVLVDTTQPAPVEETQADRDIKDLLGPKEASLATYVKRRTAKGEEPFPALASVPEGVTPLQQRTLNKLQADVLGPDEETKLRWVHDLARPEGDMWRRRAEAEQAEAIQRRNAALDQLTSVANSAENPAVKQLATELLHSTASSVGTDIPDTPETVR